MRSHPSPPSSAGAPAETRIQVFALGGLRVEAGGDPVADLPSQPVRCGVFLYLAVERAATRDELTALFWPETPSERARHSLSQTLYELRRRLGPGWLEGGGERLEVSPLVAVDAVEFSASAEAGRDEEALALFAGPFLDGVHLAASAPFESWVQRRRAHLLRQFQGVCRRLAASRAAGGDVEGALAVARRWAEVDPLDDEAHHRLIELLAAAGRRSDALRCYHEYERRIAAELDVQPLDETRHLAANLRGAAAIDPPPESPSTAPSVSPLAISRPAHGDREPEVRPAAREPHRTAYLRSPARRRTLVAAL
ncbi:MAG TPA: BTAD domain-containing putative transcriptional regulator, partial [Longimicrobium sp.]|nr:BTAD domain-containing putative transcriptional regulator [Longimicrobium sp.]